MNDMITLRGIVGTQPEHRVTGAGLAITDFRLASGQRRRDRTTGIWESTDTNWYTISAYRDLAINIASSINRGEHVVVTGRVRIKTWEKDGRKGTNVEVDADAVGHDLRWCTTAAVPSVRSDLGFANGASSNHDSAESTGDFAASHGFAASLEIGGPVAFGVAGGADEPPEFDETAAFDGADDSDEAGESDTRSDGFLPSGTGGFATLDS